jgi:hypothetical protein
MDVRIQVADAIRANCILERRLAIAAGVIRAGAGFVVNAVAVNVHVVVVSRAALEEEGVGDVAAEDGAAGGLF